VGREFSSFVVGEFEGVNPGFGEADGEEWLGCVVRRELSVEVPGEQRVKV
jgi:hypothetical protein